MTTWYWTVLAVGVIAFGVLWAVGQIGAGAVILVICCVIASAIDPKGRGLSRYRRAADDA